MPASSLYLVAVRWAQRLCLVAYCAVNYRPPDSRSILVSLKQFFEIFSFSVNLT